MYQYSTSIHIMGNQSGAQNDSPRSIAQYVFDSINFSLPEGTVRAFLEKRGIDGNLPYKDYADKSKVELVRADLFMWMVNGASVVGAVKDSDNGWSHSDGGYTLSKEDKRLLTAAANAIYKANGEEENVLRKEISVHSFGIMGTQFTPDDIPIPRIVGK